jgi:hypothetical protein
MISSTLSNAPTASGVDSSDWVWEGCGLGVSLYGLWLLTILVDSGSWDKKQTSQYSLITFTDVVKHGGHSKKIINTNGYPALQGVVSCLYTDKYTVKIILTMQSLSDA